MDSIRERHSFEFVMRAIEENVGVGNLPIRRFYLSVCAAKDGFGQVILSTKRDK